jgi:hypothetical protein
MLTTYDYVRLAAEAVVDPRTARRVYAGERCAPTTRERLRRAAFVLGLPVPPPAREPEGSAA